MIAPDAAVAGAARPAAASTTPRLADDLMRALYEFHRAYGCAARAVPTADPEESDLRTRLLAEEVEEYYQAVREKDVVAVADALADIVYVAFGTAHSHGVDLPAVLAEVHRSNMSKLGEDGRPVVRDDGKVLKGPGYSPPNLPPLLWPEGA